MKAPDPCAPAQMSSAGATSKSDSRSSLLTAAWAYCRVSTRKEEQEDSLDVQQSRARAFAADRGLEPRIFVEQASAKNLTGRPVLVALLAELEELPPKKRPKFLFVTALDRLSRDMVDGMYIGRTLRSLKVVLYVAGRGEVRLDTFAERAVFVGESMGGDAENEAKSKRMRDSWERRRREGKPTSNKVPYGLQLLGECDVPVRDSAEWVAKAFEWYAQGEGTHIIGKRLAEGAPPHTWLTSRVGDDGARISKTRAATRWEALRIAKLLRQSRYRETIVPADVFDAVQRRLEGLPKNGSRRLREYPLSGAMRCEGCARHLHGRASGASTTGPLRADGTRKRYTGRRRVRYYACVVCGYMVNAQRLEERFFGDVGKLVASDSLLRRWVAAPRLGKSDASAIRAEMRRLEAELSEGGVRKRRDRLFDLGITASITEIEFQRQMNRLDEEVTAKRARLVELRGALAGDDAASRTLEGARVLLSRFDELYEAADYERKREFVATVAEALGGLLVSRAGLRWKKRDEETPSLSASQPGKRI